MDRFSVVVSQNGGFATKAIPCRSYSDALRIAREFGTTRNVATVCREYQHRSVHVATFRRDPDGDGTRWYRAEV